MNTYYRNAVAFDDLKNAALYFDCVVPVLTVTEFVRKEWEPFRDKVLADLIPEQLLSYRFAEALSEVNRRGFNMWAKIAIGVHSLEPQIKGLSQEEYDGVEVDCATSYLSFVNEFGLSNWPLATEEVTATADFLDDGTEEPLPLLSLSQLKVIDVSKLSWDQIAEIRKDPIARERLRRLRLFAFENYSGKSPAFIEDDLLCRISDYDASAKQLGLQTVQGALSMVLNSKLAAGTFTGSLVAALFGQPVTALIAGAAGAVLELAGFALELKKRRLAFESLVRENPVSFISYTRALIDANVSQ